MLMLLPLLLLLHLLCLKAGARCLQLEQIFLPVLDA